MSVAYLFPGQGSQHVGMGSAFYTQSSAARAVFDHADAILGRPLSKLCFEGPEEALTATEQQQPAIFVTSVAAWRALPAERWPPPAFVAGHSLGEFAALVAAGSLAFDDGLRLVQRRGDLMAAANETAPGSMAAILGMESARVAIVCERAAAATGQPVVVANDNCPGQLVISGQETAVDAALKLAWDAGARKVVKLPISIAAHSPLMAPAAADFAAAVDATPLAPPDVPVIGNVSAAPLTTVAAIRAELKAQLTANVRWTESMSYLVDQGVATFIEIGPGTVLTSLMKRIDRKSERIKFEAEEVAA